MNDSALRGWAFAMRILVVSLLVLPFALRAHAQSDLDVVIGVVAPDRPQGDAFDAAVDEAVRQGHEMVLDEFTMNASMLGIEFSVPIEAASDVESALAAARTLVDERGAMAIVGGWGGLDVAQALSDWAHERGIAFVNAGESADHLRNEGCRPTTFHLEPSDAMYLDAMAGWYVRSGFRRWFVVRSDDERGDALLRRLRWSLDERHFGARIVDAVAASDAPDAQTLRRRVDAAEADVLVLLMPAADQVAWLGALEEAGVQTVVAGHPDLEAQSRAFMFAAREAAPDLGAQARILAFEATLDAYGAREINARYLARFGDPMEPPAWATYQAVKILYEMAFFERSSDPSVVLDRLNTEGQVFDLWKGIGTSIRPWDRQMRQSMYLVEIRADETDPFRLGLLVGQLPAIYLPGTDPNERLDQIGDLAERSRCTSR
ncbi:MAG: ABC transporter substrate-binding protein [Trueperaceae bacterium]|nr:ABC transporter substrate-binding protein [Trueperaceae bacterium]